MKAVIYARYSSDNQREESIEDQLVNVLLSLKRMALLFCATISTERFLQKRIIVPNFRI